MTFTWNPTKAKNNIHLHHISFELARRVFADPNRCEIYDDGHSTRHEHRYITIGYINFTPIYVSYVALPDDKYRIISARKATRAEVEEYYKV